MSSYTDSSERPVPHPEAEYEAALHQALLAGERSAPERLVSHFLERLRDALFREYPRIGDDTALEECALLALHDHLRHPDRYDPGKTSLWSWLLMIARRNAASLWRSRTRDRCLKERVTQEWLSENEGQRGREPGDDEPDGLPEGVSVADVQASLRRRLRMEDWNVMWLIMAREATHEACVEALRIEHLPARQQEQEVKRARDRVQAAIRRTRQEWAARGGMR